MCFIRKFTIKVLGSGYALENSIYFVNNFTYLKIFDMVKSLMPQRCNVPEYYGILA